MSLLWREALAKAFAYPEDESNADMAKLFWLVKLRWLAIASFFILTAPALAFGFLIRSQIPMYMWILGVLIVFNLWTQLLWADKRRPISSTFICFQLAFDLCALSGLLILTGGLANPFVALFFMNTALGGLLIPTRLSFSFLLLIHALLGFIQLKSLLDFSSSALPEMVMGHILLFAFWMVMRSLGAYLEQQSQRRVEARLTLERQDRLRAVGALVSGLSHEFASPLNVAKIRLERLSRGGLSEEQQSIEVQEAIHAIQSCEGVVKQINSSQVDARDFIFKKVQLSDLLEDVVSSWREIHPEVNLQVSVKDQGLTQVAPLNFAQALLNLLDNALEASDQNKSLVVDLQKQEGRVCLRVLDQGKGFSPGVLAKIGEPFNTDKEQGVGLGIYVTQIFAESMGGVLRVSNRTDRSGAVVEIEWPTREKGES